MSAEAVFFDIDGTLIDHDKQTASKTHEAIEQLKKNGVKVIFATGRGPAHIIDVQKMFQIESYICFNGSLGVYDGKNIFNHYLKEQNLKKLVQDASTQDNAMIFLNEDGGFADREPNQRIESSFHQLKESLPAVDPNIWKRQGTYQSFLYCSPVEQEGYEQRHPELRFTRWHKYAVDVNNWNQNKSVGVRSMLDHLQIDTKSTVAFGDNLNDLEMLEYVGYGVAMGDGTPEAKKNADYITQPLHENGIYYGLKHVGLI